MWQDKLVEWYVPAQVVLHFNGSQNATIFPGQKSRTRRKPFFSSNYRTAKEYSIPNTSAPTDT
jgi:hypothetical protein